MSRKVRKIDDTNHPGHGFFEVEGMHGHYSKETAERVAAQLDKADESAAPSDAPASKSSLVKVEGGSATCPSCGHRFKVATDDAGELSDEDAGDDDDQANANG